MKTASLIFTFAFIALAGINSFAAGYACVSVDRDTAVIVYSENPDASLPAHNLVVLDPSLSLAKQETANFETQDGVLFSEKYATGLRFLATVDLNVPGTSRAGRKIGGTTLGSLDQIIFEIETVSPQHPVQALVDGSVYSGEATFMKSNGESLKQDFDCRLFLGDEPPALDAE